jgi:hypothetical protein
MQRHVNFSRHKPCRSLIPLDVEEIAIKLAASAHAIPARSSTHCELSSQKHRPFIRDEGSSIHVSTSAERIVDRCCHCRVNQLQIQAGFRRRYPNHSDGGPAMARSPYPPLNNAKKLFAGMSAFSMVTIRFTNSVRLLSGPKRDPLTPNSGLGGNRSDPCIVLLDHSPRELSPIDRP